MGLASASWSGSALVSIASEATVKIVVTTEREADRLRQRQRQGQRQWPRQRHSQAETNR